MTGLHTTIRHIFLTTLLVVSIVYILTLNADVSQTRLKPEIPVAESLKKSSQPLAGYRRLAWLGDADDNDSEVNEEKNTSPEERSRLKSIDDVDGVVGDRYMEQRDCYDDVFVCVNGIEICGPMICDGKDDCGDGTDEMGCRCAQRQTECDASTCLDNWMICDGFPDCADNTDEGHCSTIPKPTCRSPDALIMCNDNVTYACQCDTVVECPDIGDEDGCWPDCHPEEWPCRDRSCIRVEEVCDGYIDCPDQSDEVECIPDCQSWEWSCSDQYCIPLDDRCDGLIDCPDQSDEQGCATTTTTTTTPTPVCRPDEWQCEADGICIPRQYWCNGLEECPDGSDEEDCFPDENVFTQGDSAGTCAVPWNLSVVLVYSIVLAVLMKLTVYV